MGMIKPAKGAKVGRLEKSKKTLKLETAPSPHGERVQPKIDAALLSKVEAAANRKKKALVRLRRTFS